MLCRGAGGEVVVVGGVKERPSALLGSGRVAVHAPLGTWGVLGPIWPLALSWGAEGAGMGCRVPGVKYGTLALCWGAEEDGRGV
jgi:hypothetical protein